MTQLRPGQIAQAGATSGQALVWDGSKWAPGSGGAVYAHQDSPWLVAAGGETRLNLSTTPVAGSLVVWIDGAVKQPTVDYTLSGSVVTFPSPLTAGQKVSGYYLATTSPGASTLTPGVSDAFNRADNASSLGTADTGQAWSALNGTWGIKSNKAALYTASGGQEIAVIDTGSVNVAVQAIISTPSAQPFDAGVVTKVADATTYLLAALFKGTGTGNGTITLYKCVSGTFTTLGSYTPASALAPNTNYTLKIVSTATTATVYLGGTSVISYPLTSGEQTTFNSNTKHGIRINSGTDSTLRSEIDNFSVA